MGRIRSGAISISMSTRSPNKPLDPIIGEFIKFIYSKEGQQVVIKDGFFPLKAAAIEKELKNLD